ncbi:MAG: ribosome maturation factor RimP [Candidatus Omnitrophica bacterium]|nr:ribosome maturation factor RimP [Candidatus Omnitrophota bacterium]
MVTTLIESVRQLAEPIVTSQGLELVDIECFSDSKGWILRIYIDKESGVTLEHCRSVSEQLGDLIDVKDIIPYRYILEVSSPGVNRVIKREKDFVRFCGETVKVKVSEPIDGRKSFQGTLRDCKGGTIVIETDGKLFTIPLTLIAKANIAYQFPELTKKSKKDR